MKITIGKLKSLIKETMHFGHTNDKCDQCENPLTPEDQVHWDDNGMHGKVTTCRHCEDPMGEHDVVTCDACDGRGTMWDEACVTCGGKGEHKRNFDYIEEANKTRTVNYVECENCRGTGEDIDPEGTFQTGNIIKCKSCKGTGQRKRK